MVSTRGRAPFQKRTLVRVGRQRGSRGEGGRGGGRVSGALEEVAAYGWDQVGAAQGVLRQGVEHGQPGRRPEGTTVGDRAVDLDDRAGRDLRQDVVERSEEHTSELQSPEYISYAVGRGLPAHAG